MPNVTLRTGGMVTYNYILDILFLVKCLINEM